MKLSELKPDVQRRVIAFARKKIATTGHENPSSFAACTVMGIASGAQAMGLYSGGCVISVDGNGVASVGLSGRIKLPDMAVNRLTEIVQCPLIPGFSARAATEIEGLSNIIVDGDEFLVQSDDDLNVSVTSKSSPEKSEAMMNVISLFLEMCAKKTNIDLDSVTVESIDEAGIDFNEKGEPQ